MQTYPWQIYQAFSRQIDLEFDNITLLATGVDNRDPSLSTFTKERIRLPINLKGLGIRDLETRGASEYIGGMVQGISLLLDRQDKDGLLVCGRLKPDRVINWLGSSSFDSETIDPWAQIMEQNSEIVNAITHAWTEISSAYNQTHVEMDLEVDMLNNPATRAGFAADGKITKRSTTQIITSKLETAKFKLLKYSVEHKTKDGSSFKPQTKNTLFLTTQIPTLHTSWLRYHACLESCTIESCMKHSVNTLSSQVQQ